MVACDGGRCFYAGVFFLWEWRCRGTVQCRWHVCCPDSGPQKAIFGFRGLFLSPGVTVMWSAKSTHLLRIEFVHYCFVYRKTCKTCRGFSMPYTTCKEHER